MRTSFPFFLSFYFFFFWEEGAGGEQGVSSGNEKRANGKDRRHQRYTDSKCSHLLMRWQTRHAVVQWLEWRQVHVCEMTQADRRSCYTSY